MAHEFIDLKGLLLLVLVTIPLTLSTNIDCGGKPFHCLNTTHFMICVDLGSGVSTTIDDFIIPCPPTTVCQKDNRFECEFPKIKEPTIPLHVIGVSSQSEKSVSTQIMDSTITVPPNEPIKVSPLPEKSETTVLPSIGKTTSSWKNEILENLKEEFTGGNEKIFEENIVQLTNSVNLSHSLDLQQKLDNPPPRTDSVKIDTFSTIEPVLTTTSKYNDSKVDNIIVSEVSNAFPVEASGTFTSYSVEPVTEILIKDAEPKGIFESITPSPTEISATNVPVRVSGINASISEVTGSDTVGLITINVHNTSYKLNSSEGIDQNYINVLNQTLDNSPKKLKLATTVPSIKIERSFNIDHDPNTISTNHQTDNHDLQQNVSRTVHTTETVNEMIVDILNTTETYLVTTSKYNHLNADDYVTGPGVMSNNSLTAEANSTIISNSVEKITEIFRKDGEQKSTNTANAPKLITTHVPKSEVTDGFTTINEHSTSNTLNTRTGVDQNYIDALNQTKDKFVKLDLTTTISNISIELNSNRDQGPDNRDVQQNVSNPVHTPGTVNEMTVDTLSTTETFLTITSKYNDHKVDNVIVTEPVTNNSLIVNLNNVVANDSVQFITENKGIYETATVSPIEITTVNLPVNVSYDLEITNLNKAFIEMPSVMIFNHTSSLPDERYTMQSIKSPDLLITPVAQSVSQSLSTDEQNYTMRDLNRSITTHDHILNDGKKLSSEFNIETKAGNETITILSEGNIKFGTNKTEKDSFDTDLFHREETIIHNMNITNFTDSQLPKIGNITTGTVILSNNQTSVVELSITTDEQHMINTGNNSIKSNSFVENSTNSVQIQEPISLFTSKNELFTDSSPIANTFNTNMFDAFSSGIESTTMTNVGSSVSENKISLTSSLGVESEASQFTTVLSADNVYNVPNDTLRNLTMSSNSIKRENASVLSRTTAKMQTESTTISSLNNITSAVTESQGQNIITQSIFLYTNKSSINNEITNNNTNTNSGTVYEDMQPIAVGYTASFDIEADRGQNISSYTNTTTSQKVSNVSPLQFSMPTEENNDATLKPSENVVKNVELRGQNITSVMETVKQESFTIPTPLITESVPEGIYSKKLTTGTALLSTTTSGYVYLETSTTLVEPDIIELQTAYIDRIPTFSAPKEVTTEKQSNATANKNLIGTAIPISHTVDFAGTHNVTTNKLVTSNNDQTSGNYFNGLSTSPTPKETMTEKQLNLTVNRFLTTPALPGTNNVVKIGIQIKSLNVSQNGQNASSLQIEKRETIHKQLNMTGNQVVYSTMNSFSQHNKIDLVAIGTPPSTEKTNGNHLGSISSSLITEQVIIRNQPNITVDTILPGTMTSTSQQIAYDFVKVGTKTVSPDVLTTTSTEQAIGKDLNSISTISSVNRIEKNQQATVEDSSKINFNIAFESLPIVETVNDTHKIAGRTIRSDIILKEVAFINGTQAGNANNTTLFNSGKYEILKEEGLLLKRILSQNNTIIPNTSRDLSHKEDLNLNIVNGTLTDRQVNIDIPSDANDKESSAENYKSSIPVNEFVFQIKVTSPKPPIDNKSVDNTGYKSLLSIANITKTVLNSTKKSTWSNKSTLFSSAKSSISIFGGDKEQVKEENKPAVNRTEAKVNNLPENQNIKEQQIKPLNDTTVPHRINVNINYTQNNQVGIKSNSSSLVRRFIHSPVKIANNEENITITVDCLKVTRGKYADSKDCRKFYICVGKLRPIVGICPNNTVFSEINKQCTRNLSHCVRNNQFHCLYEGRFSDVLKDNIYYICVKSKTDGFLRYKLQCQNGYHLNKVTTKCEKNVEIYNQSEISLSTSNNASNDQSRSMPKSDMSENSESNDFACKKEGKFSYSKDCRKYYVCTKNSKDEYRRKVKTCSSDEIYDKKKKKCVPGESEEC